jgi:hypothetical protein
MHDLHFKYLFARVFTAALIAGMGLAVLWRPCYASPIPYFKRLKGLAPADRSRIDRVLAARKAAEDVPDAYGWYLAFTIVALGGLELIPIVPMILPYALVCLAFAGFTLLAYLRFRRAGERRVAPLVRRSPLRVLSPVLVAAMIACFIATVALAAYPPERVSAIVAAAAIVILGFVSWRIAQAPALLLGEDPQWEYVVDEHVRVCRARNVAAITCAPAVVVITLAYPSMVSGFHAYATIALPVVQAAFVVSAILSLGSIFHPVRAA